MSRSGRPNGIITRIQRWENKVGRAYYRTGDSVWEVRIPKKHRLVKTGMLAGESQEIRKNLRARKHEGTKEAAEEKKIMG